MEPAGIVGRFGAHLIVGRATGNRKTGKETGMKFQPTHPGNMPFHVASSELIVRDLAALSAWYQNVIGLRVLAEMAERVDLGVDGAVLLSLVRGRDVSVAPVELPGLFHNAFLVPDRAALANWLAHARATGVALTGASDHLVSEALYLDDPEGNGIEIYRDRDRSEWTFSAGDFVDMDVLPLDLGSLYDEGRHTPWTGMKPGTTLGHIHLKVSSFSQTRDFLERLLGFDLMLSLTGARFYASGRYHHHFGTNVWHSSGRPKRTNQLTGLKSYTVNFNDREAYDGVMKNLQSAHIPVRQTGSTVAVDDPWGMTVHLTAGEKLS